MSLQLARNAGLHSASPLHNDTDGAYPEDCVTESHPMSPTSDWSLGDKMVE